MTRIDAGTSQFQSWGRYPRVEQTVVTRDWRDEPLPIVEGSLLPRGLGRSYGDSCLNEGNTLIATRGMNRLIGFDAATGIVRCESGVTLDELLEHSVPRGWFPPVTPGTRFVTIGGAVANDVHGKNHHACGSFGNFVRELELVRSNGSRRICSAEREPELFAATIGGLGLTGIIDWVEFQMKPIRNRSIDVETIRMGGLDEFFALSSESERDFEYLVAWIDTVGSPGRGLFMRGNHNHTGGTAAAKAGKPLLAVPFDLPEIALSRFTIGTFNTLFYHKQWSRVARATVDYIPFFYPLDALLDWNRMYGASGLLQWQCLVPFEGGPEAIREILEEAGKSGQASFLTVLKTMGHVPSLGMMSFPKPGITLALDFARRDAVENLLQRLDKIVAEAGGRLYPAKDARMPAAYFRQFYPRWEEFSRYIDPKFSSSFWRRVTAK